jgi:hypothetical protein
MGFLFSEVLPLTPWALRLAVNGRWRRIDWKNIFKFWLEERTPEQLEGKGTRDFLKENK